jgi:hypothetical protein
VSYSIASAIGTATALYLLFGVLGPRIDDMVSASCVKGDRRQFCLSPEQGRRWYRGK